MIPKHRKEISVVRHLGIFRKQISLWEAVALITSATIGAGVLGIPYAVAQVGFPIGLLYLIVLGFLIIGLNLLLGEVVIRTKERLQLSGLARKYLGRYGEWIMTGVIYLTMLAVLVIYIIGEGETLAVLFSGSAFFWSCLFFFIASFLVVIGMRTIKVAEMILTLGILAVVFLMIMFSAPHVAWPHLRHTNLLNLFLPYGVILFAYSGSAAIPEAYTLLNQNKQQFKKAILIAGGICMAVYILFAVMVVGVTGVETTEIATIGLGERLGPMVLVLGNLFAFLAMGTSFLVSALALRDSLSWDYKVPKHLASLLVIGLPFVIFLLGLRHFIAVMDVVGGVLISISMLLIILIYWRAKQKKSVPIGRYRLHHAAFLVVFLILALSIGAAYSVIKLF